MNTQSQPSNNNSLIYIIAGFLVVLFTYYFFFKSSPSSSGGGGGGEDGGTSEIVCNPSLWTSKMIVLPTTFTSQRTNLNECEAQKIAQVNGYRAFILCKNGDFMSISGTTFSAMETACTECKIYYTTDFTFNYITEDVVHPVEELPIITGCPSTRYEYCNPSSVDKVYIISTCKASSDLVKKFITEGKLSGYDDERIIKCCKDPDRCRADNIKSFPTVICSDNDTIISGYCP